MLVLKNRNARELREANSHARLSHSKQLLKYSPTVLASLFTDENTYSGHTETHTERSTVCRTIDGMHIHRPRRKTLRDKPSAQHAINVQSLTVSSVS